MEKKNQELDFDLDRSAWVNEKFEPKDQLENRFEEISRNGYTIFENKLNENEIQHAIKKVDEVYESQISDIGGEKNLIEIGEQGIVRNLLQYDDFFLKLIKHDDIIPVLNHFLGEYYLLHQFNGNLNIPKLQATSSPWHRDLTFHHFTSSRPICLTCIWVLDDFNEINNGISVLPGTHKHDVFPSFDYVKKSQNKIYAKSGSVIVLDGMVFHRSGFNNSDNRRRICQGMYTLPMVGQQISIPKTLNDNYKNDPYLKRLLGYNNIQQPNPLTWRKERLNNKRKNLKNSMVEE